MATLPEAPGAYGQPPRPAERRIERAHARFVAGLHVGERAPVGVVQMQRDASERRLPSDGAHQLAHLARVADADRVAERDLGGAELEELAHELHHRRRRHLALVGAAAHGRHVGAYGDAILARELDHPARARELLVDAAVQVAAIVRLARRKEDVAATCTPPAARKRA